MKSVTYYARFCLEKDGGYSVIFPDLRIATQGEDMQDSIEHAKNVLELWLDMKEDDNDIIYSPSTLEELEAEADDYWAIENFDDEADRDYYRSCELSYEFVPITVTPPSEIYLSKMQPHPRTLIEEQRQSA